MLLCFSKNVVKFELFFTYVTANNLGKWHTIFYLFPRSAEKSTETRNADNVSLKNLIKSNSMHFFSVQLSKRADDTNYPEILRRYMIPRVWKTWLPCHNLGPDHAMITAWRPCFLAWSSWFMAWSSCFSCFFQKNGLFGNVFSNSCCHIPLYGTLDWL